MSTHNIPFLNIKKRNSLEIILNLRLRDFFQGTQERVRNSRGKRAISVRAIEVLLYQYDLGKHVTLKQRWFNLRR